MPRITLTPSTIDKAACPQGQRKLDLFDTRTRGLMLEVRPTGKTYYLRYQTVRGKTRQMRLANAEDVTLTQARHLAEQARNKIAMGEDPAQDRAAQRAVPTFAAFIQDQYLPHIKTYKRSWDTDVSLLKNHLLPRFGKMHLDEITRQDIQRVHHDRRASGAAPGSANRLLILMRYAFNLAIKWEVPGVKANPSKDVPLMEENNKLERYLTQEEAHRLYDAVCGSENPMLRFIMPMLLMTGARKREVLNARWEDFDLERRLWRVPISKNGKARHVPLSSGVLTLLSGLPETGHGRHLFPNPATGKPYVSIFCAWNTARKNAGLPKVRMHDLRHSFASFLINGGRSLYEVQRILGHTQSKTTQRYAHLRHDTLLDAADAATAAMGALIVPALLAQA